MCTLQTRPSPSARAVVDVPGAITATRQTNAPAKARELIMIFVNFIFIVVLSFLLSVVVLAFFWLLIVRSHLWPFTDVLGRIVRFVTRKKIETLRITDCTDIPDKGDVSKRGLPRSRW
jgi:hypothetical protein